MEFKRETVIYLEDYDGKYARIVIKHEADGVYNIVHTYVSEEHRGEGLAEKLVKEALSFIEKHNGRIKADCSYAVEYFKLKGIATVDDDPCAGGTCRLNYLLEDKE